MITIADELTTYLEMTALLQKDLPRFATASADPRLAMRYEDIATLNLALRGALETLRVILHDLDAYLVLVQRRESDALLAEQHRVRIANKATQVNPLYQE